MAYLGRNIQPRGQTEANDEELPVIQQDDPTGGELNPMVNDEPMDVKDIPF